MKKKYNFKDINSFQILEIKILMMEKGDSFKSLTYIIRFLKTTINIAQYVYDMKVIYILIFIIQILIIYCVDCFLSNNHN